VAEKIPQALHKCMFIVIKYLGTFLVEKLLWEQLPSATAVVNEGLRTADCREDLFVDRHGNLGFKRFALAPNLGRPERVKSVYSDI
jgi:hypothetical protein